MKPGALTRVASGGELSRVSLAIQVAASDNATTPTLIFDEVDAGVGGATADIVGAKLRASANTLTPPHNWITSLIMCWPFTVMSGRCQIS